MRKTLTLLLAFAPPQVVLSPLHICPFVRENQSGPRAHNLFPQALTAPGCPDRWCPWCRSTLAWPGWPLDADHVIPANRYRPEQPAELNSLVTWMQLCKMSACYAVSHFPPWIEQLCGMSGLQGKQAAFHWELQWQSSHSPGWNSQRSLLFLVLIKSIKQKITVDRVFKLCYPEHKCEPWYRPEGI